MNLLVCRVVSGCLKIISLGCCRRLDNVSLLFSHIMIITFVRMRRVLLVFLGLLVVFSSRGYGLYITIKKYAFFCRFSYGMVFVFSWK